MKYKDGLRMLREMNVAGGPGGMFGYGGGGGDIGMHGGDVGNTDWYAPGDTRIPSILGASGKKGKRGKKKKMHVYRRSFIESLALESRRDNIVILNCVLYTEHIDYQQIILDILKSTKTPYLRDDNSFILEGTDEYLNLVLNVIKETLTSEPFEQNEIISLIGEMTFSANDLQGIAAHKTILDFYHKFDPDRRQSMESFTDDFFVLLQQGVEVEKEHTSNTDIAEKIARDHLWEDLDYYKKLAKIENKESR